MTDIYYPVAGDTLPIFFSTYDGGTGASITMTGLAVTDVEIYKDGGVTQRASDSGYTLLDTDGIDFDSLTGIHGFSIDLSDDDDAGFFEVGPWYHVVVASVTIDGQTVNFIPAAFRIVSATRGLAGTALPNAAADAAGGLVISDAGGVDADAQAASVAAIEVDTGTTLQGEVDGIQADTEDIQARLPAALVGGRIDATVDATGLESGAAGVIADAVWDEDATGHQTGGTFGQAIGDPGANTETMYDAVITDAAGTNVAADIIAIDGNVDQLHEAVILRRDTAQAGGNTSITLDAGASAVDDFYKDSLVVIVDGTGAGQNRVVTTYNGTSKVATTQSIWGTNPDATSVFVLISGGGVTVEGWRGGAPASLQSSRVNAFVGAMDSNTITSNAFAAGSITASAIAADAIGASELAADAVAEIADAVLDEALSGHTTAGTLGKAVADIETDAAAILDDTDDIGVAGAGLSGIPWNADWDTEVQSEVQDALDGTLADSVPADGTRPSLAQAVYMVVQFLTERAVSGTDVSVKKVDGSTELFGLALDDATSPTSISRDA
jgi:hypothetical protein